MDVRFSAIFATGERGDGSYISRTETASSAAPSDTVSCSIDGTSLLSGVTKSEASAEYAEGQGMIPKDPKQDKDFSKVPSRGGEQEPSPQSDDFPVKSSASLSDANKIARSLSPAHDPKANILAKRR